MTGFGEIWKWHFGWEREVIGGRDFCAVLAAFGGIDPLDGGQKNAGYGRMVCSRCSRQRVMGGGDCSLGHSIHHRYDGTFELSSCVVPPLALLRIESIQMV